MNEEPRTLEDRVADLEQLVDALIAERDRATVAANFADQFQAFRDRMRAQSKEENR